MSEIEDVLISVRPQYARSLLSGSKSVELRRRAPRLRSGTRVWVYTKSPEARVEALAILDRVEVKTVPEMWEEYASRIDIALNDFNRYLSGSRSAAALVFSAVHTLDTPVTLSEMRSIIGEFQPPQFYKKLAIAPSLIARLKKEVA